MAKRSAQLEGELKRLSGEATTNLYRRLEISSALLKDADWLAIHSGSIDVGEQYLADTYFSEFRGLVEFAKLHAMFNKFPKATWEEHRFDIAAMEILYRDSLPQEERPAVTRRAYKEDVERLTDELTESKAILATERRAAEAARKECADLNDRVRELERENAELRGRIQELERLSNRQLAAA